MIGEACIAIQRYENLIIINMHIYILSDNTHPTNLLSQRFKIDDVPAETRESYAIPWLDMIAFTQGRVRAGQHQQPPSGRCRQTG